ncbi:hypothetical protein N8609_00875 [Verrucomicrobia bacterium]|nr:hypothetical protein [Verrucomicrobiota bacterium]
MKQKNSKQNRSQNDAGRKLQKALPHAFLLSVPQWIGVLAVFLVLVLFLPTAWEAWESFDPELNYRVPYETSQDYWQYERHLKQRTQGSDIFFVGDSVVWGEYVTADATWSAFLNEQAAGEYQFVNLALNGLYPLALEGLVRHYGSDLRQGKVMLHCNLLWMSSPSADLSQSKEQVFNHPTLVPQFRVSIPSYRATLDTRLGRAIGHQWSFLAWVRHLQIQYWEQKDPYAWTLADNGKYPPAYPNSYTMPWSVVDGRLISELERDPDRGLQSTRHKPWSEEGVGTQRFDWVPLNDSLQWQAFQRLCQVLRDRGNDLIVVLGPFNQHIMTADNRAKFKAIENEVKQWLESRSIVYSAPKLLDSSLYGDASHPLTQGYRQLAESLWNDSDFKEWLAVPK